MLDKQQGARLANLWDEAKAAGMSYKTAWDAIDAMNKLAGKPLVERSTGGRGGGSARLTPHGQQLVDRFSQIQAVHDRFVRLLGEEGLDLSREFEVMRMLNVKTSARNQLTGTVSGYKAGDVDDEIELTLRGGARVVAVWHAASSKNVPEVPARESAASNA